MSRHGRTKLVPPNPEPEKNQTLETLEESNQSEQTQEPALTELANEIECLDAMKFWNCVQALIN
jgi:hypothetical protein